MKKKKLSININVSKNSKLNGKRTFLYLSKNTRQRIFVWFFKVIVQQQRLRQQHNKEKKRCLTAEIDKWDEPLTHTRTELGTGKCAAPLFDLKPVLCCHGVLFFLKETNRRTNNDDIFDEVRRVISSQLISSSSSSQNVCLLSKRTPTFSVGG